MGHPIRAKIRRWYVANAIYFVTAVTRDRRPIFAQASNLALLRQVLHAVQKLHPFHMHAYAFLPDHLHLLIYVPETTNISKVMQSLQWNYTREYKAAHGLAESVSLWQRGYWDHVIRNERGFDRHLSYIHYNPVKHGLVEHPADYAETSFREYVKRGWYGEAWCQDPKIEVLE